jgi:hypothetical protein
LLAKNDIEAGIIQSEIERATLKPFDWCTMDCWKRLRDCDHSRIKIDANDAPAKADMFCCSACNDARSASYVQHSFA